MIEKLVLQDGVYLAENGITYDRKKDYLQMEVLNFCGCGDPDALMMYVRDFLQRLEKHEWGEYEDMAYMFMCSWLDHKGFLDHGTSIRCGWLTDSGKELLNDINWCIENEKDEDDDE